VQHRIFLNDLYNKNLAFRAVNPGQQNIVKRIDFNIRNVCTSVKIAVI